LSFKYFIWTPPPMFSLLYHLSILLPFDIFSKPYKQYLRTIFCFPLLIIFFYFFFFASLFPSRTKVKLPSTRTEGTQDHIFRFLFHVLSL
jgi:hypothetical protein